MLGCHPSTYLYVPALQGTPVLEAGGQRSPGGHSTGTTVPLGHM